MRTTSRAKSLQIRVLMHGAGIAVAAVLIGAGWKAASSLHERRACLENELSVSADLASREREIRARHDQLSQQVQSLRTAAVRRREADARTPNDAALLAELSRLAGAADLTIKSFAPGQSSANGMAVQITATARFRGIGKFLDGLANIGYVCEVTQFSIAAPQHDDGLCTLELTLRALVVAKLPQTLASTTGGR